MAAHRAASSASHDPFPVFDQAAVIRMELDLVKHLAAAEKHAFSKLYKTTAIDDVPHRTAAHGAAAGRLVAMEFVDAVRLVYDLANGMELTAQQAISPELKRQAESQSEVLDLICEWLHAQAAY